MVQANVKSGVRTVRMAARERKALCDAMAVLFGLKEIGVETKGIEKSLGCVVAWADCGGAGNPFDILEKKGDGEGDGKDKETQNSG